MVFSKNFSGWDSESQNTGSHTQDTVPKKKKGEETSETRLKDMVRRFLEQKIIGRLFDARRHDKTLEGVAVKRKYGKRRSRERNKKTALDGSSERQCSKADSCCFKHDEKKKKVTEKKEIQHDLLSETETDLLKETAKVPRAKAKRRQAIWQKETSQFASSSCTENGRILLAIMLGTLSVPNTKKTKYGCRIGEKCYC